jgi:hypothetical protein
MVASFSGSSISSPGEWVDERPSAAAHAAHHLATRRLDEQQGQGRERRRADFFVATLIRHAQLRHTPAVLPLAVAVIQPPFLTSLVASIRRTALLSPRLVPAPLRAVPLAPVARAAHVEHRPARARPAKPLSEKDLIGLAHRP